MNKKSQIALEYLMTYGWVIIVVMIAIGTLVYYDFFSLGTLLPNRCVLSQGIQCVDHKVDSTNNQITVLLRNGLGHDITSMVVKSTNCDENSSLTGIQNGEIGTYTLKNCAFSGDRYNGDLNITYKLPDTGLTHTTSGSVIARLE